MIWARGTHGDLQMA